MTGIKKLDNSFYDRADVVRIARELLGKVLVTTFEGQLTSGRIVEVEAYNGVVDRASHAWSGRRTRRTEVMYREGGTAYVYLIYGIHHLFNVVTNKRDVPHAVLVRAVEPVEGIELATHGPGLLCRAMHIDRSSSGVDLEGPALWIERPAGAWRKPKIDKATRIGVDYAGDWAQKPWRFLDRDSPYVSTVSAGKRKRALG